MLHRIGVALIVCLCTVCSVSTAGAQFSEARSRPTRVRSGVITGGVDETSIRIANDLASVLDDGDSVRVLQ